jgi:SAM-dependent methyltransferase
LPETSNEVHTPRQVRRSGELRSGPELAHQVRVLTAQSHAGLDERPVSSGGACRHCDAPLRHTVVDLGMSPLCETFPSADELNRMEPFYPLCAWVCDACWLVQVQEYVRPEQIFHEYPYFSSYSTSWLQHAERYVRGVVQRLGLGPQSLVVELGSNDGYLLQYFATSAVPALGIEPARNVAEAARARGVPTLVRMFDEACARDLVGPGGDKLAVAAGLAHWRPAGRRPDLICGANVLAQVSDLNGFVRAIEHLLAPDGVVTIEFPHLERLIADNQFDTIYHEHFSYFSFTAAERIFAAHGLVLFDVEELPTHGGSLRIWGRHAASRRWPVRARVGALRAREAAAGVTTLEYYADFARRVEDVKHGLLEFLIDARRRGRRTVGYGAPGKANTLLNYCGIRTDLLHYTVDRNPYKQGRVTPGTHIPILSPDAISRTRPDYVLILPWNLTAEIVEQMAHVRDWGGRFVVPIPEVKVIA